MKFKWLWVGLSKGTYVLFGWEYSPHIDGYEFHFGPLSLLTWKEK